MSIGILAPFIHRGRGKKGSLEPSADHVEPYDINKMHGVVGSVVVLSAEQDAHRFEDHDTQLCSYRNHICPDSF